MKNGTENFWRACMLILAGSILVLVLLTVSGCGRREAEFLKNAGQSEVLEGIGQDETEDSGNTGQDKEKSLKDAGQNEEKSLENAGRNEEKSLEDAGHSEKEIRSDASQGAAAGQEETVQQEPRIYVDVCGAVASPGVYELEADSRVFQALEAAGGCLPEAAGEYVNRAGRLEDGQQIYIPTREEAENDPSLKGPLELTISDGNAGNGSLDTGSAESAGKVNLNTADEAALTTLSGIGASKAQAILAYREEHGGFSAIEEILNVPGIKEGTFVKIKDNIAVE